MDMTAHLETLTDGDARAFRHIIHLLKAQPEAEPSPGLHDRIVAASHAARRTPNAFMWRWGLGIAASLLILLSLATILRPGKKEQGTHWLAENQEADGTWSPARHGGTETFRPALTALSLLALSQHSQAYPQQIAKGVSALERLQTAEGSFGGDDGQAQLYNLAITTYALATCGVGGGTLPRAIACIASCQQSDGSWTYAGNQEGNAAVTAWMTRALESAETHGIAGAGIPLRKGLRWLRNNVRDDGQMAYHPTSAPSDTLTALSAYSLMAASKMFPDLQALGIRMANALPIQPSDTADCYRDYAKILAFESAGNTASAADIRNQLRQRQTATDQWDIAGGQVYIAALMTLSR